MKEIQNRLTLKTNQNLSTMSRYDIVNGKWTFRATPLDYLHCIFNEYEWLLLLKGNNKPYEELIDPLYEIAHKKRCGDEELAGTKITMKWLGERLQVNTSKLSKWITLMYNDIIALNESNPESFMRPGQFLCCFSFRSYRDDYVQFYIGLDYIPRKDDNFTFYFAKASIDEGNFIITDVTIDHDYGHTTIHIDCSPRYHHNEYKTWLLEKARFLNDINLWTLPPDELVLDDMLRAYARKGHMPTEEQIRNEWKNRWK